MPFRWAYVALPVIFFVLSIILGIISVLQMPPVVLYHFRGGTADSSLTRAAFLGWIIAPQLFFMIISLAIARVVMLGARYAPQGETPLSTLLPVMGNMMALPQVILFIAMLQFFLYNAYQTSIVPLWIIAVIILVLGGVTLVIYFTRIIRRYRRRQVKINQE